MTKLSKLLAFALLISVSSYAQTIKVATAANLQSVIKILGDDFKKRSGIGIEPIVGSSGKLVAQISNGAPYDVFLSADIEFPQKLAKDGFADGQPVVYALGSLVLCTGVNFDVKYWYEWVNIGSVNKIAIANPTIAPYGRAAEEVLKKYKYLERLKSKIVYGESISQVNTYIATGVVTVGFTSLSFVKDPANTNKIGWKEMDPRDYSPIKQGMVKLSHSENKKEAQAFFKYMRSASAKSILKKYGYIIP